MIIGIGNELRGDDALGVYVVRELQDQNPDLATYHIESDDPTRLIELWAGKDVVIVDAIDAEGMDSGKVYVVTSLDELLTEEEYLFSSHSLGLKQAIELGKSLAKYPKSCFFIGVQGRNWRLGDDMSKAVYQAKSIVKKRILEYFRKSL